MQMPMSGFSSEDSMEAGTGALTSQHQSHSNPVQTREEEGVLNAHKQGLKIYFKIYLSFYYIRLSRWVHLPFNVR